MAEGRVLAVKVQLDERSAKKAGDDAARQMQTGLNQIQNNAREAGRKAGDALGLGIENGSRRASSAIRALSVGLAALGGLQVFKQLGEQALQAAIQIDKTRQAIAALVGGVDNANKKLAELRQLAASSPGVTTSFATQLYQQLRAVGTIADQTINKVIQSVGKLNAVFSLENPSGFARNIQQIFDQGFERGDIKEALGQVPIFEQLLEQAFGTRDPDKLRKLKEAGKLTAETYYSGIIEAINQRFPTVSESIGAQFEKIKDQAITSLEPFGRFLAEDILGAIEILKPSVSELWERMKIFAAEVGPELQKALVESLKLTASLIDSFVAFDKQTNVLSKLGFVFNALIGAQALFLRGLTETVNYIRDALTPVINRLLAGIEIVGRFGSAIPGVGGALGSAADAAANAYAAFNLNKAPGTITDNTRGKSLIGESASSLLGVFNRGGGGGGGGTAGRARRTGGITLPTLTSDDLITSDQALQAVINEREAAIFRGRQTRAELTAAFEASERKDQIASGRLSRKALTQDLEEQEDALKRQAEALKNLKPVLSDGERFMRGFASAVETTGDAFERLGLSIADSFRDVGNLFSNLKRSILGFFNDLLGQNLQRLFGQLLAPIAGLFGGGGFGLPGGGNLFRTPSFAGSIQNFFGGGIEVPGSVSQTQQLTRLVSDIAGPATRPRTVAGAAGATAARGGFSLGGLFGGLASAAPLLGLSLGAGLGGQSTFGNILGAVGGGAVGLGLSFGASVFSAGGGLGSAALAALGPIALIGAPLLVGAIFAGKAAQRRKDEQASGEYLTQAIRSIEELARGVASGQIPASQARSIFDSQILGTFRSQISSLKTKSVVESRLTNQVRDLEKVYRDLVEPAIQQQIKQQRDAARFSAIDSRLIPQFAGGGTVPGIDRGFDSVRALVRPGELILTKQQQNAVMARAGSDVFKNAGVPGVNYSGAFASGGYAPPAGPMVIELDVKVGMSTSDATSIVSAAARTKDGQDIIVDATNRGQRRRNG